jgi:hypothetical protein
MPLSSVVGAQSIVKPGVCTSSTKPASPYDGQVIYMTDVDQTAVWDGSNWIGLERSMDRNAIINGGMNIDQRLAGSVMSNIGASITIDRWFVFSTKAGLQFSAQQSTDAPVGFKNSILLTVTGTAANPDAGDQNGIGQKIEGHNAARFLFGSANAKTLTISFWVKSSVTGTFGVSIRNADVTRSRVEAYTINSANTWEYKVVTIPGCPDGTWLTNNGIGMDVQWDLGTGSTYQQSAGTWTSANKYALSGSTKLTANSGATFRLTGVQVEAGAVATPFEYENYGMTLRKCMRYYQNSYEQSVIPGTNTGGQPNKTGTVNNSQYGMTPRIIFPVPMRSSPTVTIYAADGTVGQWTWDIIGVGGEQKTSYVEVISSKGFTISTASLTAARNNAWGYWTATIEL